MLRSQDRQVAVHARRTAAAVFLAVCVLSPTASTAIGDSIFLNPEPPPPPPAATSATLTARLAPDKLAARAALTVTIHYSGGASGVPSPVRRSVLRMPAGMTLDVPHLRSCNARSLRRRGVSACPARSQIGTGRALVETRAGSQILTEEVVLHTFLGPPRDLVPTFEILARGYTPLDERVVFSGSVLTTSAPYGEELVMSIPPVATLPMESDASVVAFSLTVGASTRHRTRDQTAVRVPSACPVGGFPLAGEFSYADGSTGSAVTTIPCPPPPAPTAPAPPAAASPAATPAALAARTFSLNEASSLHVTSKHGFTLNEQGSASGTIRGTIYVHLTIVSTSRVTAEVNIYPRGGSISGYGTASYERGTALATFSGSASITHGSGSYAHAHGSGLSFSGTIARSTDAVTVHVSGRVSD